MGVEDNLIGILLNDKVCAVNLCCCKCRMISVEDCGAVKNVSAGYTKSTDAYSVVLGE